MIRGEPGRPVIAHSLIRAAASSPVVVVMGDREVAQRADPSQDHVSITDLLTISAKTLVFHWKGLTRIPTKPTPLSVKQTPFARRSTRVARNLGSVAPNLLQGEARLPPIVRMPRASDSRKCCRALALRHAARRRIGFAPVASPSTANPPCSVRGCRLLTNFVSMAA